jgi:AcrR family transcriptional regulator
MRAAEALIGELGPRAFTLREVARRAGVSHNAPYRHFASRDELLLAVAAEGFDRLRATMERRMEHGGSARERLVLCGCGYVEFALQWPSHFLVMFDLAGLLHGEGGKAQIGESAFRVLLDAIVAAQEAGVLPADDPIPRAWTAWSLVHGISKLAIGGNLPLSRRKTLDFTRQAGESILQGIEHSGSQPETR